MDEKKTEGPEEAKQVLRKRRFGMAFLAHIVPLTLVALFLGYDFVSFKIFTICLVYMLLSHLVFFLLLHTGINLKFRDPSLTAIQIASTFIPTMFILYFLDEGQARAAFVMVVVIPMLFGILALNTRQFIQLSLFFLFLYSITVWALWRDRPEVLDNPLELVQAIAILLVLVTASAMGGYISGLRKKLRNRNQELNEAIARIEELVNIDSLTGICNRRRLFEVLTQEKNRYSRAQGPFSVCIMDIDHFKEVNDTYGHQAGDEILRDIACEISQKLRNIDSFGRYGGEEFLMILPQTPMEGAVVKAERVRQQVESLRFPAVSQQLRVTISIGVAAYRNLENIDATLARADQRLYDAKNSGRNRVVAGRSK